MPALSQKKLDNAAPEIELIFGKLQPNAPKEYYDVKLNVLHELYLPGTVREKEKLMGIKLNLLSKNEFPQIPKVLANNAQCLIATVDEQFPLLPTELVVEDFITALADEFDHLPKNTIVLERTTNFATLYFVVANMKIEGDSARPIEQDIKFAEEEPKILTAMGFEDAKFDWSVKGISLFVGEKIATTVATKIGGAIASAILAEFFPPGAPDYFDEVYKKITQIVGQKIQQNNIDSINGAINNVVQKINNEYVPARQQSDISKEKDRKRLFNLLQKYDQTFLSGPGGMLGTLQLKDNAQPGFPVFILGASIQLAIIQEMANVDPFNGSEKDGWKESTQSSYGKPKTGTLAKTAKEFSDFADKTFDKIIAARRAQVTVQKIWIFGKHPGKWYKKKFSGLRSTHWGRIMDNGVYMDIEKYIGADKKDKSNSRLDKFIKNEVADFKDKREAELHTTMNYPRDIIKAWRKVVITPIRLK
jgi:hypothetical protein